MRLFTVQKKVVYECLADGQHYQARPRQEREHWLNDDADPVLAAYEWLAGQMAARGLPRPAPDVFPVWAWLQWAGPARAKPDLRSACLKSWARDGRHVLMSLEVEPTEALVHDYDAWHWCLNYWYLAPEHRRRAFERHCKRRGGSYYDCKPHPDPACHAGIQASWAAIFEPEKARKLLQTRKRDQQLQATLWTLQPHHVVQAVEFGMGLARRTLPKLSR